MGLEQRCVVRHGRVKSQGKALLETSDLQFRGESSLNKPFRLNIPFREMKTCRALDGVLEVAWPGGTARFELGDAAAKWAARIANPKRRIDKLDVKPGHLVSVIGLADDAAFLAELRERAGDVRTGRLAKNSNVVFLGLIDGKGLARLAAAAKAITPGGAIWVVWPKGRPALKEDHVRAAALAGGLVDVKVASFSETLSALKLVIPVAKRPKR